MQKFLVERYNEPTLEFEGELLASRDTKDRGTGRFWQEVRIYRVFSDDGSVKFVTEIVRMTTVEGEPVIRTVNVFDRPEDVQKGMFREDRKTGKQFVTNVAWAALQDATKIEPRIGATERI